MMSQFDTWHHTRLRLLSFTVVELALAYGLAALSIDRGSLWWYLLTLIFLVGALTNFFKLIGTLLHNGKRRQTN